MKKHFIPGLIAFIIASFVPFYAFAQFSGVTKTPFGGQILTKNIPGIDCVAQYGALAIKPVVIAPPGPYFITATSAAIKSGDWVIGWYSPIPKFTTCFTTGPTPLPIPSFNLSVPSDTTQ